jgi:hypothetical protein
MERGVLVQRSMGPRLIIVGSIGAYDPAQVRFTEHDRIARLMFLRLKRSGQCTSRGLRPAPEFARGQLAAGISVERTANAANNETGRGHRRTYGVTRPFLRVAGRRGACGSIGFERPTVLFSLRPAELIQGFFMQDLNLSQVSLRFFNAVPYGVQLFLERHLASTIQRGFKALDAKCRTSGKGISLLCSVAGRHGSILEFAGT